MNVREAYDLIRGATSHNFGNFFHSTHVEEPLGVGQVYKNIRYPLYNDKEDIFETAEALIYVLSHECDVAQENERPYNEYVLVCPIIPLDSCLNYLMETKSESSMTDFCSKLGKDLVSRVVYVPPIYQELEFGGLLYFNQICYSSVSNFEEKDNYVATTSEAALGVIDYNLLNHLFRPKEAGVPMMGIGRT